MDQACASIRFYSDASRGRGVPDEVKSWFLSDRRPAAHGSISVPGHWGEVYQLGKLIHDVDPRWPAVVRAWLTSTNGVPPEALLVVWVPVGSAAGAADRRRTT